jgi:hypothetical protein
MEEIFQKIVIEERCALSLRQHGIHEEGLAGERGRLVALR